MKYGIYSVRDVNVGFNQPFLDPTDASAKRGFAYACLNTDMMGFAPKDFDLYKVGEFDTDTAEIKPIFPVVLIMRATELDYGKEMPDET